MTDYHKEETELDESLTSTAPVSSPKEETQPEDEWLDDEANITKETVNGVTTYTINDSMGRREISVAPASTSENKENTTQQVCLS